ncbi:LuxR C-terminal-related transcriptional regulator [Noviherbaspirillum galbum]|uniref:Helix-turn-helix transcriptional regulator n=1 Tax=Noviherbaspirillum galbum TaxID=2709383 RepID=A0A6B3SF75_9BURK|nr:LuxR C-terminal-related transcriptional regulator [Noviherbaspirillum galbum]NEX59471.1 helix-turn-helix transcriptional regulator [Noviherbaspirillum galbum]
MTDSAVPARLFLSTKLNPPTATAAQVTRGAICELVGASGATKLVLVRAPAGFGKTTAMAQCKELLAGRGIDTAWLTLDGADNDASRFLSCLAAAVGGMMAERGAGAIDTATGLARPPGEVALEIIARLAAHPAPFVLFLDDFEAVQEPTVLRLVREILDNLPRGGQLIIGSRGLPDLGLGRLRARGQLLEIDAERLRFSLAETVEFMTQRRRLALPEDDLAQLQRKTEGWIAALWLASVALERRDAPSAFITRFSGSNEAVADYLAEDVLAHQPPEIRNFLLKTSILRHLNPSLCSALLPGSDGAGILRHLEEANLFLTPIDAQERTYRYHSLFASYLRAQLEREFPEEVIGLHRAASQWYEAQGRPVPAIDHAIEGHDYEHAVALLSRHAESLLESGRMRLLSRWFAALPEATTQRSPLLQVIHVWALCFTRGPAEAMALLERCGCATSSDPKILAHVIALRPLMLAIMDRQEEAYAAGQDALARMPVADAFIGGVLSNEMAYICAVMGDYQHAHRLLDAARQGQGGEGSFFNKMYSESVEGLIDLEAGQFRQATARFRMAVNATHSASYRHTGGNAWAGVLYASSLYEMNDLDQAEHLLHVYVPLAKDVGLADHTIIGYTMLSRIAFHRGDVDHAFHNLAELEYLGHYRQLPRVVNSAKLERSRLLLMQGNLQAAREELERANPPGAWERIARLRLPAHDLEYHALAELRWQLSAGQANEALAAVDAEIQAAQGARRQRRVLKLRILQCIALKQIGDQRPALDRMKELLRLAANEGFVRLIVDESERAGALVRQVAETQQSDGGNEPIFQDYLHKLMQAFGPAVNVMESTPAAATGALVEPLTTKEIRILGLLAEGYSNSALAEKLFVSDSTVRTHLRNINGKLQAHNRTQAVALARRLGVIR